MRRREIVKVAIGKEPADTVVVGGRVVNVHTLEIHAGDVAIKGDRIAAVGDVAHTIGDRTTVIDAAGAYVTPGLVDGHLHMYHSYLGITEFVEAMLRHGVTSTADGFYGQGIVGGPDAVRFFKDSFGTMPMRLIFLVPTLAYLQNRELGLTPASGISKDEMFEMLGWPDCYGLEEPPYLPITWEWEEFLDLFEATLDAGKIISGHASGITPRELQAYVGMGAATDHETVDSLDGLQKVRAGMKLLMREGSGCTNVAELVRVRTEYGVDVSTLGFCADVASPEKLWKDGGVDQNIRVAIANGVEPAEAVRMASLSIAQTFRRDHDLGSVTAGRFADLLLVDDLPSFHINTVMFGGQVVVEDGTFKANLPAVTYPESFYGTVQVSTKVTTEDLRLQAPADGDSVVVRALEVKEGTLVTRETMHDLEVRDGIVQPDVERDVLQISMVDRLGKGTGIGVGFVTGFGLKRGAFATSVNAVCENILVVGANADDMAVAVNELARVGGGKIVVADGEVLALVELPLLGLLSEDPTSVVMGKFDKAFEQIRQLGCDLASPFSQLEFSGACGEIGDLKISEEGLVRVDPPEKVDVIVSTSEGSRNNIL
jgi:adenine deaminase